MEAHENHGGLLPGDVVLRGEAGDGGAVHQAQAIGHDDVAAVGPDVLEGQGHVLNQPGDAAVAQAPDQHGGGLAASDERVGAEAAVLAGDGPVVIGRLHGAGVPGLFGHVLVDGPGGGGGFPAEEAAEHHQELRPGHLLPGSKGAVGLQVEVFQGHAALNVPLGPEVLRHVGDGGGGDGYHTGQQDAQQKAAEGLSQMLHSSHSLINGMTLLS